MNPEKDKGEASQPHPKTNALDKQALFQEWRERIHQTRQFISLAQAADDSFEQLEASLLDKNTQNNMQQLLVYLERVKALVLPDYSPSPLSVRPFLSAYLIATKSQEVFESPAHLDQDLLTKAQQMLQRFEELNGLVADTPIDTAAVQPLLADFHQDYMDYGNLYEQWEKHHRNQMLTSTISCYLKIEAERFTIINSLDPKKLELYEAYEHQQNTLRESIAALQDKEAMNTLNRKVSLLWDNLEANQWLTSTQEGLTHEVALRPGFTLKESDCIIQSLTGIDTALAALTQEPPDIHPVLNIIEEIRNQLILFNPGKGILAALHIAFDKQAIEKQVQEQGLHLVWEGLIGIIKELECPTHWQKTTQFITTLAEQPLGEILHFIYNKLSQITWEYSAIRIAARQELDHSEAILFEQQSFKRHMKQGQFNLIHVQGWLDKILQSPQDYGLNTSILCSQYAGGYLTYTLLLGLLQQRDPSRLQMIPETFYIDRVHIIDWHTQYQTILCTATCLGLLEFYCNKYGIQLTADDLLTLKDKLFSALSSGSLNTSQKRADYLLSMLHNQLAGQALVNLMDQQTFHLQIKRVGTENSHVTDNFNQRISDYLSCLWQKDSPWPIPKLYSLQDELDSLYQAIYPRLRLHAQVHGSFYQQQIDKRLWNPLFDVLKTNALHIEQYPLLLPAQSAIKCIRMSIHKLAYTLTGLTLIKQLLDSKDVKGMDHEMLRVAAESSGFLTMIHKPEILFFDLEKAMKELLQRTVDSFSFVYSHQEDQRMQTMLRQAKEEHHPIYTSFHNEVVEICKQSILHNKKPVLNSTKLLVEFEPGIFFIAEDLQRIVNNIKRAVSSDVKNPLSEEQSEHVSMQMVV